MPAMDGEACASVHDTGKHGPSGPSMTMLNQSGPRKLHHLAVVHSKPRSSCLSHDAEVTPSFLGFRNLMVLVLSTFSGIIWLLGPIYLLLTVWC